MNKAYIILVSFSLFFQACQKSTTEDDVQKDIVLKAGKSVICSSKTTFSIEPEDNASVPDIDILKDIQKQQTTISVDISSVGGVVVKDCEVI